MSIGVSWRFLHCAVMSPVCRTCRRRAASKRRERLSDSTDFALLSLLRPLAQRCQVSRHVARVALAHAQCRHRRVRHRPGRSRSQRTMFPACWQCAGDQLARSDALQRRADMHSGPVTPGMSGTRCRRTGAAHAAALRIARRGGPPRPSCSQLQASAGPQRRVAILRSHGQLGQPLQEATTAHSSASVQAELPGRHAAHLDAVARDPVELARASSCRVASTSGPGSGCMLLPMSLLRHARRAVALHALVAKAGRAAQRPCAASRSGGGSMSRARSRTDWRIAVSSSVYTGCVCCSVADDVVQRRHRRQAAAPSAPATSKRGERRPPRCSTVLHRIRASIRAHSRAASRGARMADGVTHSLIAGSVAHASPCRRCSRRLAGLRACAAAPQHGGARRARARPPAAGAVPVRHCHTIPGVPAARGTLGAFAGALRPAQLHRRPHAQPRRTLLARWIVAAAGAGARHADAEHGRVAGRRARHGGLPAGAAMNAGRQRAAGRGRPRRDRRASAGVLIVGGAADLRRRDAAARAGRCAGAAAPRGRRAVDRRRRRRRFRASCWRALFAYSPAAQRRAGAAAPPATRWWSASPAHMWWWEVRYRDPASGARDRAPPTRSASRSAAPVYLGAGQRRRDPQLLGARAGRQDGHGARPRAAPALSRPTGPASTAASAPSSAASSMRGWRCTWWRKPPDDFDAWLAAQAQPARRPRDAAPRSAAAQVFLAQRCDACHTVRGVGRRQPARARPHARRQPPAPRRRHAAATRRETLRAGSPHVQQLKPGARMPSYERLDAQTLRALAAWLESAADERRSTSHRVRVLPNSLPRPAGEREALERAWEPPQRLARALGREQHPHRPVLHRAPRCCSSCWPACWRC